MSRRTNLDHMVCLLEYLRAFNASSNNNVRALVELKSIVHLHYQALTEHRDDHTEPYFNFLKDTLMSYYLSNDERYRKPKPILLDTLSKIA